MNHHFDVGAVLNIIAVQACDLAIHDEVLGMESADHGTVVVNHLEVNMGDFFLFGKANLLPAVRFNNCVVLEDLAGGTPVIHELHNDILSVAGLDAFGKFSDGI